MAIDLKRAIKIAKTADLDVYPGYEFGNSIETFANHMKWNAGYAENDNDEGYHPVAEGDIVVDGTGTMGEGEDEFEFCMQFVFPQDEETMYLCYGEIDGEFVEDMSDFFDTFEAIFEDDDEDDDDDDDDDEEYDDDEDDEDDDDDEEYDEDDDEEDEERPRRTPSSMRVSDLERADDSFKRRGR